MPDTRPQHIVIAVTLAKPGGAQSFVFQYASWLKQRGFQVTLLAGEGEWLLEQAEAAEIPCLRVPWMQREINPWADVRAILSLARLLRRLRPDVLHLNSSKMGVIGSIAGRLARVPRIIYCIGGWAFLEHIAPWKKRFYAIAERLTASFKDVIICLHPGDKRAAEERGIQPRESIAVIPNGIDIQALDNTRLSRSEARQALNIPPDCFTFGTIAHFYPAKNLPEYLEQAAPVLQMSPSSCIVLIGEGQERAKIESVIREHNLTHQVILTGSQEQAHRFLAAFDVFVLPSTKEGMPFSLLEAMVARLPCIVTDVGANAWVLEETGSWIIPACDASALQQAFQQALSSRGPLVEIGQRNRTAAETRFPLETTYEAQLAVLLGSFRKT